MSAEPRYANGRVTCVLTTYNRSHLLPVALETAFAQTAADRCDIVIVDDGSTDDTRDVVARYGDRVRYVYQENAGLAAARNTGIRATDNEFVGFLDDDDAWDPRKVELQLAAFERWPAALFIAGRCDATYADGRVRRDAEPPLATDTLTDFAPALFRGNFLHVPALLVRRSAFDQAGMFCEPLRRTQDLHMWTRLASCGPGVYLSDCVATYADDTAGALSRNVAAAMRYEMMGRMRLADALARRPDCKPIWREGVAWRYGTMRDRAYRDGKYLRAADFGLRSLWYNPRRRPRWEWTKVADALLRALRHAKPPATATEQVS